MNWPDALLLVSVGFALGVPLGVTLLLRVLEGIEL